MLMRKPMKDYLRAAEDYLEKLITRKEGLRNARNK